MTFDNTYSMWFQIHYMTGIVLLLYTIFEDSFEDLICRAGCMGFVIGSLLFPSLVRFPYMKLNNLFWSVVLIYLFLYLKWTIGTILNWNLPTFLLLLFSNQNPLFHFCPRHPQFDLEWIFFSFSSKYICFH